MECPTCSQSFRTQQGMRQHHTKVHDDPLPNRTCEGCQTEFYDPKSRREYCDDCNPNAGKHNGNWKDAKERTECTMCGTVFSYYPSNKRGDYCPDCVEDADGLLPENPSEKGPRVSVDCLFCDSELEVYPSRADHRTRGCFCDQDCYADWLAENVVGPDHHQWEGGQIDYGQKWWRIRREARRRDDYQCQQCGASREELGQNPDVHHLVPVREFDRPEEAHTLSNVITLCRSCHRRVEEGAITVTPRTKK
ncbi:HNH endonuclease [Halomontanus rarus]|uniref:HNH endonuclease n=1 Tax=Halomontanus rarus TaxID=3034020 RepID=UPI001A99724F